METITEEELIQMVIDFLESEPTSEISDPLPLVNQSQASHFSALMEIIWRATDSEAAILEKIMMYSLASSKEPNYNTKKRLVSSLKRDGYEASLCRTSWICFHGLARGDYEFVDVTIRDDNGGLSTRVIVEIDFRSHFELARPTQSYKKLVDALPSIFVGSDEKLGNVVSLLCSAAKQSLRENGLHIPPWRKANYIRTKWFSENCKKIF